jgi:nucleotidyltransferase/DNA polymerase involved in DNA repair
MRVGQDLNSAHQSKLKREARSGATSGLVAVGYPAKRGVMAVASYEGRRFGVRSATPSKIAVRKCADLVFVPPRLQVYRAVSRQIHATFTEYTPSVEPLSLDEAYLDMTDHLREGGRPSRPGLTERKDLPPVVLHTDDGPVFLFCFGIERGGDDADLGIGQPLRWTISVLTYCIVVQYKHR